jgi:hypothetical protein
VVARKAKADVEVVSDVEILSFEGDMDGEVSGGTEGDILLRLCLRLRLLLLLLLLVLLLFLLLLLLLLLGATCQRLGCRGWSSCGLTGGSGTV